MTQDIKTIGLMSSGAENTYTQIQAKLPNDLKHFLDQLCSEIVSKSSSWSKTADTTLAARMAIRLIDRNVFGVPNQEHSFLKCALLAALALRAPSQIHKLQLPNSILSLYAARFDRTAKALLECLRHDKKSIDELLSKEIRIILGMTVPGGSQIVDLESYVPVSSAILSVFRSRSASAFLHYLKCRGAGVWFRSHTDERYLDEFNEKGRERFFLRVAQLLKVYPNVRGLVGTSWFYDPQVLHVSPRLAFLQQRPLDRGAFLLRHGSGRVHIERATRTSRSRRRMYMEGNYLPLCYSLLWCRDELLHWADSTSPTL